MLPAKVSFSVYFEGKSFDKKVNAVEQERVP